MIEILAIILEFLVYITLNYGCFISLWCNELKNWPAASYNERIVYSISDESGLTLINSRCMVASLCIINIVCVTALGHGIDKHC